MLETKSIIFNVKSMDPTLVSNTLRLEMAIQCNLKGKLDTLGNVVSQFRLVDLMATVIPGVTLIRNYSPTPTKCELDLYIIMYNTAFIIVTPLYDGLCFYIFHLLLRSLQCQPITYQYCALLLTYDLCLQISVIVCTQDYFRILQNFVNNYAQQCHKQKLIRS